MPDDGPTVGYRFTDCDPFDVSIYPTGDDQPHPGMLIVRHPVGGSHMMKPAEDGFWSKDPGEIRDIAIRGYVDSMDWENSPIDAVQAIYDDADALGVLDDG